MAERDSFNELRSISIFEPREEERDPRPMTDPGDPESLSLRQGYTH